MQSSVMHWTAGTSARSRCPRPSALPGSEVLSAAQGRRTGPAKTHFSQAPQTLQGSLPEAMSFTTELQVTFVLQALGEAALTRVWL